MTCWNNAEKLYEVQDIKKFLNFWQLLSINTSQLSLVFCKRNLCVHYATIAMYVIFHKYMHHKYTFDIIDLRYQQFRIQQL